MKRRRGGHLSSGPSIDEIDLNTIDWAASVKCNRIADEIVRFACGPHGPFQSTLARDPNCREVACREYWPEEHLASVAAASGCTSQEVLDVIILYRD